MIRNCTHLLIIAGLATLAIPAARAGDTAALSGSYRLIQTTEVEGQTRIQLQIHLANHGANELSIQRMTFWDFSHPAKGGTQSCAVVIPAAKSADATQEFMLPRAEYELWKRGTRPRLVLEIATPQGRPTTQVVRLERIAGRKGN